MFFMQADVQKSLKKRLDTLSKFRIDFPLTKNTFNQTLKKFFFSDYKEPTSNDDNTLLDDYYK